MDEQRRRGRETLNKLGEQWYHMPKRGNEAARSALCARIFDLAFRLFPKSEKSMGLFFERDWKNFNPEKGDLYGFMAFRLEKRKTDVEREDAIRADSLDAPADGKDGPAMGDAVAGRAGAYSSATMVDETLLDLITLMFGLKNRLSGRAANSDRINYYRLFFTDGVAAAIRSCGNVQPFVRRERDLFRVIKQTFLNFFLCAPCACAEDILDAGLKPYGQMVEGRPMEPPKHPLPNDVYTTYLAQVEHKPVTDSAVSQQRTAYRRFMKEQLLS